MAGQSIYAAHFNINTLIIVKYLLHVINTSLRNMLLLFQCFFKLIDKTTQSQNVNSTDLVKIHQKG